MVCDIRMTQRYAGTVMIRFFLLCLALLWGKGAMAQVGADSRERAMLKLDNYIGVWTIENESLHCLSPIVIEMGDNPGSVKMTKGSDSFAREVLPNTPFDFPPKNKVHDYEDFRLLSSSSYRFIRGKIVSMSLLISDNRNDNAWMGVAIHNWILKDGKLTQKKAGLIMNDKPENLLEHHDIIFSLDKEDTLIQWEIQCEYIRSSH